MFRPGLVATLSALILTGCVSSYAYRDGDGGDYYYSEPEIEYYDIYGRPYGIIGYGYPGGWYGHFGYFFGPYYPYWRHDYRYGHPGYGHWPPYGPPYRPPSHHRPPNTPPGDGGHQPRPPRPPGTPPIARPPREDHERENGPWRPPEERLPGRRMATPQPMQPVQPRDTPPRGNAEGPRRTPFTMSQPAQGGERAQRPPPPPRQEPVAPPPRPRMDPPAGRFDRPERESRRDPEP